MLNGPRVRKRAESVVRALVDRRCEVRDERQLGRSAVVFAPHPDDETLGCGGTILRKRRVGADVRIVVLTDGSGSHRAFMDERRLREIRAAEVVEAAARLGVAADRVHLLGFPDRGLESARDAAADRVRALLRSIRPEEVYIPHRDDPPADHRAARAIVLDASGPDGAPFVYEYPVWFWFHWPWVATPLNNRRDLPRLVRDNARSVLRLVKTLNSAVYIGDVLEEKRRALDAYASQMTRLVDDPAWARLEDVAGGQFLARFFEPHEMFHACEGGKIEP